MLSAFTAPDGYTKLNLGEWETDEAANKLTLGTMTVDVLSLNATSFEMGYGEALDAETGELMDGEFRWKYSRMDETQKTLAEKLIGKWNYSKSYEKIMVSGWRFTPECKMKVGFGRNSLSVL